MNSEISEKLKKLLTLNKGATGAEAELAMEKAQKLATKYNIDLAILAIDIPKEEFTEGEFEEGRRKCVCQRWISRILQNHYNVDLVYSGSRYSGQKILFYGRKSEVEFAIYVQSFLKDYMMRSWDYYRKSNKVETRFRASYFDGFYRGLNTKLTEAKRQQEKASFEEMPEFIREESQSKYQMVISNEGNLREEFKCKKNPTLRTIKGARLNYYGGDASSSGFNAGYTTSINKPLGGQLCLN